MIGFIKQMLIVLVLMLLGFGGSLATRYLSMNNQLSMHRLTLIDLNPDEFHYYPFIISLGKCNRSYNTAEAPLVEYVSPIK